MITKKVEEGGSQGGGEVARDFVRGDWRMCLEIVYGVCKLGEEMLAHAGVFWLGVDDAGLLSFRGRLAIWLSFIGCAGGAAAGEVDDVGGGRLQTDDGSREDGLGLRPLLEGSELRIKGAHRSRGTGQSAANELFFIKYLF